MFLRIFLCAIKFKICQLWEQHFVFYRIVKALVSVKIYDIIIWRLLLNNEIDISYPNYYFLENWWKPSYYFYLKWCRIRMKKFWGICSTPWLIKYIHLLIFFLINPATVGGIQEIACLHLYIKTFKFRDTKKFN